MKGIHAIAAAVIILGSFAAASMAVDFSAGIKGGLGIADFKGSGVNVIGVVPYQNAPLLRATGGIALNAEFSNIIGAEIDILYAMKGSQAEGSNSAHVFDFWTGTMKTITAEAEQKYTLNYLDIPVLVKFLIPLESKVKPAFFMGSSLNILLASKMNQRIDSAFFDSTGTMPDTSRLPVAIDTTYDRKSSTKPLDVDLVIGASVAWEMGPGNIVIDVRYSFGFSDFYKKDLSLASLQNTHFALLVGYNYRF